MREVAGQLRNNDGLIQRGAGKGLFLNVGDSAATYLLGTCDPQLQDFMQQSLFRGMTFYDVGANVGFYSMIAARLVDKTGNVISFEPLPENLRALEGNATANHFPNIKIFPFALGCRNEEAIFLVSERPTWGKLDGIGEPPDQYSTNIRVKVGRLDSLIAQYDLPNPDLVKIDVEGAEVEVLNGARQLLTRNRPIVIVELHGTNRPIHTFFEEIGYFATALDDCVPDITQAHWNTLVVAVPSEKRDQVAPALARCALGWEAFAEQ
jgi:FkbM family methyltransferase